jgi:hypothetical protein
VRAEEIRHGSGEHDHGFEHGRAKVAPKPPDFSAIREVATTNLQWNATKFPSGIPALRIVQ